MPGVFVYMSLIGYGSMAVWLFTLLLLSFYYYYYSVFVWESDVVCVSNGRAPCIEYSVL